MLLQACVLFVLSAVRKAGMGFTPFEASPEAFSKNNGQLAAAQVAHVNEPSKAGLLGPSGRQ
jgi:hypothetical protein